MQDNTFQFKIQQDPGQPAYRQTRLLNQGVNVHWIAVQRLKDFSLKGRKGRGNGTAGFPWRSFFRFFRGRENVREFLDNVPGMLHQFGTLFDQCGVPVLLNELMLPGTANTSLFCSAARRAVMREPLRSVASTITVPRDMPEMTRLRMGK